MADTNTIDVKTDSSLAESFRTSQVDIEAEKADLARTLHDELGALLVGAIMDLGWIANQAGLPKRVKEKLARAQGLMRIAIDIKRDLIEKIRPTLLDNVGLFSTLRWHMKCCCEAVSAPYEQIVPDAESPLTPEVRIGVFRIFQEALRQILAGRSAGGLKLEVVVIDEVLHCHLVHESGEQDFGKHAPLPETTTMHHRAVGLGGTVKWRTTLAGRHMHLKVPLSANRA